MARLVALLIATLAVCQFASAIDGLDFGSEQRHLTGHNSSDRILWKDSAKGKGRFPFLARVSLVESDQYYCDAAVLSDQVVLASGEFIGVYGRKANDLKVLLLEQGNWKEFKVESMHQFRDKHSRRGYLFALKTKEKLFKYGQSSSAAIEIGSTEGLSTGTRVSYLSTIEVVGGRIVASNTATEVVVKIADDESCQRSKRFCVQQVDPKTCVASRGALVTRSSSLIGLLSFSLLPECSGKAFPVIEIAAWKDEIEEYIQSAV